jgi:hypothetical protein
MPVCFLHYSIVWASIKGVDVVAHNGSALSVSLRTVCVRRAGGAVAALSAATPQCGLCCLKIHRPLAPAGMTIDTSAGNTRPATKSARAQNKEQNE